MPNRFEIKGCNPFDWVIQGLLWWLSGKKSTCSEGGAEDSGSILGSGRFLEEEMAAHSSMLAWKIPWSEEPGGLQSMGLQRAGHDWVTKHNTEQLVVQYCAVYILRNASTINIFSKKVMYLLNLGTWITYYIPIYALLSKNVWNTKKI